jgi:hypothetical protein
MTTKISLTAQHLPLSWEIILPESRIIPWRGKYEDGSRIVQYGILSEPQRLNDVFIARLD